MTLEGHIAILIRTGISLLFLWMLIRWGWRDYRLESVRQKLYVVRDELFDAATAGVIDFNHRAYGMLRTTINGYIRFAHHLNTTKILTLGVMLLFAPSLRKSGDYNKRFQTACEDLPTEEAKDIAIMTHRRVSVIMFKHVVLGSPIFLPLLILTVICLAIRNKITRLRHVIEDFASQGPVMREIEQEAEIYGSQESGTELAAST